MRGAICAWTVASLTLLMAETADATTLDFESLNNGEIVSTQFSASHGVTISAINTGDGPNLAIAFGV